MSFLSLSFAFSVRFEIDNFVMHVSVFIYLKQFYFILFFIFIIAMTNYYDNDVFSLLQLITHPV